MPPQGPSEVNPASAEAALLGGAGAEADVPGMVFSAASAAVPARPRPHHPGAAEAPTVAFHGGRAPPGCQVPALQSWQTIRPELAKV